MNHRYTFQLLILFTLLSFGKSFSQIISVDTTANWQQGISSILGGNCVEISNVVYSNQPGSAATFSQANVIGLESGIVLSTGMIGPSISASSDLFLTHSFQEISQDSLLEQYAIQELGYTGNATSFDASRLSFDFLSPTNQEVTIRFVFASEEYPEFAPPNNNFFNDIFAFFVRAEGTTEFQNIALVPGTNLPVTVGNINAITNSEFYQESIGVSFALDAYTSPITATFQAQAGVVYNLVIAIADIGDSAFDSAVFLEFGENNSQTIHGEAFYNNEPLIDASVNLYGFNTDPGAFDVVASDLTNLEGEYAIADIEQGLYIVHVVPNNNLYPNALPVYFPGVVLWEEATGIGISCDSIDVDGPGMIFNTGPGEISGTIGQDPEGGRLRSNELIPYENVNVFLQDSASGEWRGYEVSDVWGKYNFENLSYGTYYVYPDVAGIPILEPRKVIINSISPTAEGINFIMNEDGVLDIQGIEPIALIDTGSNVEWTVSALFHYSSAGSNVKLKLGVDTVISDTLYTSIWAHGTDDALDVFNEDEAIFIGGFRQLGSKLYLRLMNSLSEIHDKDILYFDGNYEVGDTIRYPFNNLNINQKAVIISRDTFELNGISRVRWEYSSLALDNGMFISGIGNGKGLFNLLAPEGLINIEFVNICYTDKNGNSNFAQDIFSVIDFQFDVCFLTTAIKDGNEKTSIELYPNPGKSSFTIRQEVFEKSEIVVRDLSGKEHLRSQVLQEVQSFNTETLDAGVYIIELKNQKGASSFACWIKQ